jgi:Whirly transcription factor
MALSLKILKSQRGSVSAVDTRMLSSVGTSLRYCARNKTAAIEASIFGRLVKNQSTYARGLRSFPQYFVGSETAGLALKTMLPGLRVARGDILTHDNTRKGRMLLEFTPRGVDGKYVWNDVLRFGLSVEECGLLVNQLPHYKVEFSRAPQKLLAQTNNMMEPDKVLTVEPAELGAVDFTIDFVLNGIGGQTPPPNEGSQVSPQVSICASRR